MRAKSVLLAGCLVAVCLLFTAKDASAQVVRVARQRTVVTSTVVSPYGYGTVIVRRPVYLYPRYYTPTVYYQAYPVVVYPGVFNGGVTYFYRY